MAKIVLWTAKTCVKCPAAKKIFKEIAQELNLKEGIDYEIKNIDEGDNMIEALTYQVASTPSFVIDNELFFPGEVPDKDELKKIIKEKFGSVN